MNGRRRFSYPSFSGFPGYGEDLEGMAGGRGSEALNRMTRMGKPYTPTSDPLWSEIEGTFQKILGDYANLDLDMPIKPPDMNDPQDQMRYLKDLEALGMSSAPSAALMQRNVTGALDLIKQQHKMEKEHTDLLLKVLPLVQDNKELSALLATGLLNRMMPGQFDITEKSGDPTVSRLTPEAATKGELYQGLKAGSMSTVMSLFEASDEEGLNQFMQTLGEQLANAGMSPGVIEAITDGLYEEAKREYHARRMAEKDLY